MQIYCYQPQSSQSLDESIKAGGRIAALAVLFEVRARETAGGLSGQEGWMSGGVEGWMDGGSE